MSESFSPYPLLGNEHYMTIGYTWQYDIRWAATELRKTGFMIEATESPRGIWQLK